MVVPEIALTEPIALPAAAAPADCWARAPEEEAENNHARAKVVAIATRNPWDIPFSVVLMPLLNLHRQKAQNTRFTKFYFALHILALAKQILTNAASNAPRDHSAISRFSANGH